MNKTTVVGLLLAVFMLVGCCDKTWCIGFAADFLVVTPQPMKKNPGSMIIDKGSHISVTGQQQIMGFIPKGYKLFDKVYGDLNKDGLMDCVLIIKATRKDSFVKDRDGHKVDRNRRGIIILFTHGNGYKLALKNESCFSSENEDGGCYDPPELNVSIKDSKLYLHYNYGRYGYWEYCFRYQNSDFMLIGYEASHDRGPVALFTTSINFLTGVEYDDENINADKFDADSDDDSEIDEVFKRTVVKLKKKPLMKLSEIEDFDELKY